MERLLPQYIRLRAMKEDTRVSYRDRHKSHSDIDPGKALSSEGLPVHRHGATTHALPLMAATFPSLQHTRVFALGK